MTPDYTPAPEHWNSELQDSLDMGVGFATRTKADLLSHLLLNSYIANRGYGMEAETYANMMKWSPELAAKYESAYQLHLENQRHETRYSELIEEIL